MMDDEDREQSSDGEDAFWGGILTIILLIAMYLFLRLIFFGG